MALVESADYPNQPPEGAWSLNDNEPKNSLGEFFDQFLLPDLFQPDQEALEQYALGDAGNLFGLDSPFQGDFAVDHLMFSPGTTHSDSTSMLSPWRATPHLAANSSVPASSALRHGHDPTLYQTLLGRAATGLKSDVFGVDGSPVLGMSTLPASPPPTPSNRVAKPRKRSTPTTSVDQKPLRWRASDRKPKVDRRKKSTDPSKKANAPPLAVSTPPPAQVFSTASGLAPPANSLPLSPPPSAKAPSDGFPTTFQVPAVAGEQKLSYQGSLPFRTINWHAGCPPSNDAEATLSVGAGSFQSRIGSFDGMMPSQSPLQPNPTGMSNGAFGGPMPWHFKEQNLLGFGAQPTQHVPTPSMSMPLAPSQLSPTTPSVWWSGAAQGSPLSPGVNGLDQRLNLMQASQKVLDMTSVGSAVPEHGNGLGIGDIGSTLAMDGLMISCDPMDSMAFPQGNATSVLPAPVTSIAPLHQTYLLSSSLDVPNGDHAKNSIVGNPTNGARGTRSRDDPDADYSPTASRSPSPVTTSAPTTARPRKQRQQRQLRGRRRRATNTHPNDPATTLNANANPNPNTLPPSPPASRHLPPTALAGSPTRRGSSRRSYSAAMIGSRGGRGTSRGNGGRHYSSSSGMRSKSITAAPFPLPINQARNPSSATTTTTTANNNNPPSFHSSAKPLSTRSTTTTTMPFSTTPGNMPGTSSAVDFVNFTPLDSRKLLTGVAPSGSSKTKARRDREAADRRRKISVAAVRAVEAAGGNLELLRSEAGLMDEP